MGCALPRSRRRFGCAGVLKLALIVRRLGRRCWPDVSMLVKLVRTFSRRSGDPGTGRGTGTGTGTGECDSMIDFDKIRRPGCGHRAGRRHRSGADDGWMKPRGVRRTLRTGPACYFSRSRGRLWRRARRAPRAGSARALHGCDADTICSRSGRSVAPPAMRVTPVLFRRVDGDGVTVVGERVFDPKQVYKK